MAIHQTGGKRPSRENKQLRCHTCKKRAPMLINSPYTGNPVCQECAGSWWIPGVGVINDEDTQETAVTPE